ncbi:peptidase S8 [Cystobacter fuscus]|uniref:Peptidase S8 n=1 Tax=Cystobacter fuscus TaxID=43 RepID=A0A250JDF7_9BACT|nr:hypothetical protein [Cystobacter fuscus]ATB41608.1 peptidase S8 [Cystobacter fuscus]
MAFDQLSTVDGSSNTVENAFLQNPAAGTWTVVVLGDELVQDAHLETAAVDADYGMLDRIFQPARNSYCPGRAG